MFLSRRYRPNKWPFYAILTIEFPLTVALLAFFGIAAPDLYRTRLWQDGADNGFNSNPNAALYAAANYRPYTTPKVWSQFITNFNVVISVLSMFIMLAKAVMYMLHVFPPVLSVLIHGTLIALYAVSIDYQASSDTSDPAHLQKGPPWYITKSCSVAHSKNNIGYCQQAKAAFACTCVMLVVFVGYFGFALWSCFPSKAHQEEYAEKRRSRAERYGQLEEVKTPNGGYHLSSQVPHTPGFQGVNAVNPMTPRTMAFNRLGGTRSEAPIRSHFSSPNAPKSPTYALRSPDIPRSPMGPGFDQGASRADEEAARTGMFFPPPPKVSSKK